LSVTTIFGWYLDCQRTTIDVINAARNLSLGLDLAIQWSSRVTAVTT